MENGEDSAVCYDVSSNVAMDRVCYTMVFLLRANVASELRAGLSRDGCALALAAGPLCVAAGTTVVVVWFSRLFFFPVLVLAYVFLLDVVMVMCNDGD